MIGVSLELGAWVIGASLKLGAMTLFLAVSPPTPVSQLPELTDLDLSNWDCLPKLEGAAKTQDGKERNQQKNRSAIDLKGLKAPAFDIAAFLARAADYDRQIEKKHRREMNPAQKEPDSIPTWSIAGGYILRLHDSKAAELSAGARYVV